MNRKERRKLAKQAKPPQKRERARSKAAGLMAEGLALAQAGKPQEALAVYEQALKLDGRNTDIHYVLGVLNRQLGHPDRAAGHYRRALEVEPANANASYNLGNLLAEQGALDEAIAAYEQAVAASPDMTLAWNNLGNVLKARGRYDEAETAYRQAIAGEPGNVDALFNLGETQRFLGQRETAVATFEAALAIDPEHAASLNNLGSVLRDMKEYGRATEVLQRAIRTAPQAPMGYVNLGNTLRDMGRLEQAHIQFEKALALNPENARALTNFGNLLQDLGRFDDAGKRFEEALVHDPNLAEGHYNLGLFDLLNGRYQTGWRHFDRRWQLDDFRGGLPTFSKPLWQGQPLAGKTLLLWDEQGVGDTLLFTSLIPDLLAMDCRLRLQCDPRLVPLVARSFPDVACTAKVRAKRPVADGQDFDYHAPIGNLGRWLRGDAASFARRDSFLLADAARVAGLREAYRGTSGDLLVGVAWHSKGPDTGPRKSMTLGELTPVLACPGIRFVDLQYGDTLAERRQLARETGVELFHDDQIDQMQDLDAFAAQVRAMDMVVTISNTTAHMAGALGVPTALMLCTVPLWYWMLTGPETPWYPSLRLYRQSRAGAWQDVIKAVGEDVRAWIGSPPS